MPLNLTIQCIVFYVLMANLLVSSHDIFDMLSKANDPVVKAAVDAPTDVKATANENAGNLKNDAASTLTFKTEYRTVLNAYRHVVRDWTEKFPSENAGEYCFLLQLSSSEVDRLHKFAAASSYEEKNVLHEVHVVSDILKRAVYKIEVENSTLNDVTWSAWLRSFDINVIIKVGCFLSVIGIISFISIRVHLGSGRWFATFFIFAFITSVMQNWYGLYQEAQAKVDVVLMKQLPKHCITGSKGFFWAIISYFSGFVQLPVNECLDYQKALHAIPHTQATPIQAISVTIAQLFTTPLGEIGEKLSEFFAGTMRHVPTLSWPIVIGLIVFILVVVLLMHSRYEINLPFMMGSLRPSAHGAIQGAAREKELEDALNASKSTVKSLENTIKELEKTNRTLEYNIESKKHVSRSSSNERINLQRERSSSNRRENNELRKRTTSPLRANQSSHMETKENRDPCQPKAASNLGVQREFLPD
ncbi:unnamed protein product [Rotaria socialis]|uniref:Chloride channel CLIC-like protein 1 n=2 Tax=Rotaria socialis TaxID=392032 RepID=A0A821QY98_9BILA|nr:unnamed protein product [Rotaria socialis]CAF3471135.1 unnamed protein product [Rotaria socialis]CAF4829025.1 unnamed protein product [Rotaria socialis]